MCAAKVEVARAPHLAPSQQSLLSIPCPVARVEASQRLSLQSCEHGDDDHGRFGRHALNYSNCHAAPFLDARSSRQTRPHNHLRARGRRGLRARVLATNASTVSVGNKLCNGGSSRAARRLKWREFVRGRFRGCYSKATCAPKRSLDTRAPNVERWEHQRLEVRG